MSNLYSLSLYICIQELRIISFSIVNITEKLQLFLAFYSFENYHNLNDWIGKNCLQDKTR